MSGNVVRRCRDGAARAFTLVELFVVISVIAIAVALGVPAFSAMIQGTNRTLAENALRESISQARFLATAFEVDSAAVFLYEPGGALRIVPMIKVGEFEERPGDPFAGGGGAGPGGGGFTPGVTGPAFGSVRGGFREVFAPVADAGGFSLPRGWMVRGYVPAGRMLPTNPTLNADPEWYDSALYGGNDVASSAKLEGNWVEPEDGYFNPYVAGGSTVVPGSGPGTPRQTFMVRFEAGTGVVRFDTPPAVAVAPRGSDRNPEFVGDRALRIDLADDLSAWARSVVQAEIGQFTATGSGDPTDAPRRKARLLGVYSNETVLAGPVTRLALYQTEALAVALGARSANAATGTIYAPAAKQVNLDPYGPSNARPEIRVDVDGAATTGGERYADGVLRDWASDLDALRFSINQWMEGDANERFGSGWRAPALIGDGDTDDELDEGPIGLYLIDALSGELILSRGGGAQGGGA